MRRFVGYDLTGWRDIAARNWLEQPGEETAEGSEQIVSGGIGSVVVRVGEAPGTDGLIGGLQALRAPHGRGGGWGTVGAVDNRERVADLMVVPGDHLAKITAALRAMANPHDATAVLAIPDIGVFEEEQEALLETLRRLRARRRLLVWRPVLACLVALDRGLLEGAERVGIVSHDARGLTSQRLLMRTDQGLRAPERRRIGRAHPWGAGLAFLLERARGVLGTLSETPTRSDHLASARVLVPFALGESCGPEPVRRANGDWEIIRPPAPATPALPPVPPGLSEDLANCDLVLFDSPTTGPVRQAVLDALGATLPPVFPLSHEDVARGGLIAAGRIASGQPVYFDFLPQISTIVQDADGARNYDLIPPDAVLPAGRIYQSREPARLGLLPGMDQVRVYLRKQSLDECRLALVPLSVRAERAATVDLHVEQTPAAGRARLTLVSEAFPAPLVVDWSTAEPLEENWESIIESIRPARPTVPNRLVLPCGHEAWDGRTGGDGLRALLIGVQRTGRHQWKQLAGAMSSRPFGRYAISSDGDLPKDLEAEAVTALAAATEAAEDHVRNRLEGTVTASNDSLRFLTWQFHRCPAWIVQPLIEALGAQTGLHVFVQRGPSRQLVYQALGRITSDPVDQRTVFDHLLAQPWTTWNRDLLACAAFLLSRTDTAPTLLDRAEIDAIGRIVAVRNADAIGGRYNSSYFYAPYLMLGLLRCRLRDPWSLVAGRDPLADDMLVSTERVIDDIRLRFSRDTRIARYRKVLEQCCDELRGEGRNPDILVDVATIAGG